jgi:hypothetical protein
MTAVSGRLAGDACHFRRLRHFTGVARCSLVFLGVMALTTTGCLVTDSPEFPEPKRTPPFLTNFDPSPAEIQTIPVRPGTNPNDRNYLPAYVSFDVVSDDLGDDLEALVLLDFQGPDRPPARELCPSIPSIPPATLQSTGRNVRCDFTLTVAAGCYTVTAVVSHDFRRLSTQPVTEGDVFRTTWIYQVGVDLTDPDPYAKCIPEEKPTDGGTDAPADRGAL